MVGTYIACGLILAFAVLVGVWMVRIAKILSEIDRNLTKKGRPMSVPTGQQVAASEGFDREVKSYDRGWYSEGYSIENLEENRDLFNEQYAKYVSCSQMVSIFPLLGILGTVAGLILGNRTGDIDTMVTGLGTALWTTLAGLIASIVLKFIDSAALGNRVNLIEGHFNRIDTQITNERLANELKVAVEAERTQKTKTAQQAQRTPQAQQTQRTPQAQQTPGRSYRNLDDFAR